jgi:hypothetical protein
MCDRVLALSHGLIDVFVVTVVDTFPAHTLHSYPLHHCA